MASEFAFFGLIFPTLIFFVGLFFIYHGITRFSAKYFVSKIKIENPPSDFRGNPYIYNRIEIESHQQGIQQWKLFYSKDQRVQFSLKNILIKPENADIRCTSKKTTIGVMMQQKNILEKTVSWIVTRSSSGSRSPFNETDQSPYKYPLFDSETKTMLTRLPNLKLNNTKPYRVTESILSPSSQICIGYTDENNNSISPFLITDCNEATTRAIGREKSLLTFSIGIIFLVLSSIVYLLVLESML